MDPFSLEELFSAPRDDGSPGAQLYLYRALSLLAAQESLGSGSSPLSYLGSKKLASRLKLDSADRLKRLFVNVGLGVLELEIAPDRVKATLVSRQAPVSMSPTENKPMAGVDCSLERGLIDGALELIVKAPVRSAETSCIARGDEFCIFEAEHDVIHGNGFVPANIGGAVSGQGGIVTSNRRWELRSWFLDVTGRELARAKRHGRQLSVLYVDLDDLGHVNLAHGRSAGDQIISAVAEALCKSCRAEDFLWHHGEDEFAIVLSETGTADAETVARRIVTEIRSAAELVDISATISASIGFSTYPAHANNVADLFSRARAALHLAKSRGRGKTQSAQKLEFEDNVIENDPTAEKRSTLDGTRDFMEERRYRPSAALRAAGGIYRDPNGEKGERAVAETVDSAASDVEGQRPASVLLGSTSPLLLAGMRQLLMVSSEFEIIDEISDASRLPLMIDDIRPDLVFVDLQMAVANNFAVVRLVEAENLPCKLSVLVSEVDQDVIKLAADFSIDGVILQNSPPSDTLDGLRTIYKGKTYLPETVQSAINELESSRQLLKELSERELEVLRLVAEGKSNSQISEDLFITVNTVRFHLANIYQKLSVSNRTEAANYYLRQDFNPEGQTKLL